MGVDVGGCRERFVGEASRVHIDVELLLMARRANVVLIRCVQVYAVALISACQVRLASGSVLAGHIWCLQADTLERRIVHFYY